MNDAEIPEVDRQDGTNHPRHTKILYGHKTSQLDFLDAFNTNRLHHAWMISGPRGIGKATLGYKISKFILSRNQSSELINNELQNTLDIPLDHPVSKRIDALGEPNLYLVRRIWDEKLKKFKQNITVDEIRKLKNFFNMSATDGGWRVAIIDSADEMNNSAANALLKILEEPKLNTYFFLISHQPSSLLSTIKSRCLKINLSNHNYDNFSKIIAISNPDIDE